MNLRLIAVFSFTLFLQIADAQQASLGGHVTDESGAAVAKARVTLSGVGGKARMVGADSQGVYSFVGLTPGEYSVGAAAPQLATREARRIVLGAGPSTLDLRLSIVVQTEKLTVEEGALPSLTTDNSNNASAVVIRGDDLKALADNPEDLQADLQALAGPSAGPSGGSMYIDGFSGGQLPAKESIREIRINQNPFTPEFDKLGFGRIEIFTKPGTGKFKGMVTYNFAKDFWNARNPYASQKAPLLLNETENSVSGPLTKKASFTFDLERQLIDNGFISNGFQLDAATLTPRPFNDIFKTPQRRFMVSPRVDYQVSATNTLSLRYSFASSEVRGAGIGGFDVTSRGYRLQNIFNTVQISDTQAVNASVVEEFRFQYFRAVRNTAPDTAGPALQVLGGFTGGGAQVGNSRDAQDNYEFQNYTSVLRGKNVWRFGARLREGVDGSLSNNNFNGVYTFTSLDSYRLTLLGMRNGLTPAQIRASGGGASQFSLNTGNPYLSARQFDAGLFVGDDWRVRPALTVSLGLRYEAQTNISDRANIAPRIGIAWAPGKRSRTVIRGGFGIFYDRFALANTVTAERFGDGLQRQYLLTNPDFYPRIPDPSMLAGQGSPSVAQRVDASLRAPYILQSAFTLERQLSKTTTVAATYTNSHALHVLRSEVVGGNSLTYLMTSSGLYNQNQMIVNVNSKPLPLVSLFGYYVLNRAMSNTDGLSTFPANPRDYAGEYGPAATDIRQRGLVGGSLASKWNLRLSPYVIVQSGAPFDITTGQDRYGTTILNSRPGIAAAPGPGIIPTQYGLLDLNPGPGERILGRNAGRGPGQVFVNLRMTKTIGLGPEKGSGSATQSSRPIDASAMSAPGGLRGLFSAPSSDRRFSLTIGMSVRNLLNHTNPGVIVGNVTSPLFGRANQIAGAPNAEGFSENASNRRLELQIRLGF